MNGKSGATRGLLHKEPVLFEISSSERAGFSFATPAEDRRGVNIPKKYLRDSVEGLPELSEPQVVRHFVRLSQWNHGVDTGMYPLGSCTMKYNPKVNEQVVRQPGLTSIHPYLPADWVQGALRIIYELERDLAEISGMHAVTLQPAAGAHGEFTGMAMIRAAHMAAGNPRSKVLIPDTAHGTNPASCRLNNYQIVQLRSSEQGILDPEEVARRMDDETAAIMLTNPNTLGLFESNIREIAEIVHDRGGYVYCDGANMNSLMGRAKPGMMGIDVMQFNLHKTFSTPHGGGGPGSGPVGVAESLAPYLPIPRVEPSAEGFRLTMDRPKSIGRVKAFFGNFLVIARAYAYVREMGPQGLKQATDMAVLNANYLRARLAERYSMAFDGPCMHECVIEDRSFAKHGIKTMDIAKRLIDYGFHPPTVYFPLCVSGALMIEPTETEPPETLDEFVDAMFAILDEGMEDPEALADAPRNTHVSRLDEVRAARQPILKWTP